MSCPSADVPETAVFKCVGVRGATKFPLNAFAAAAAMAAAAICCRSEVNVKCTLFCDPPKRSSAFGVAVADCLLVDNCALLKFASNGVLIPAFADAADGILNNYELIHLKNKSFTLFLALTSKLNEELGIFTEEPPHLGLYFSRFFFFFLVSIANRTREFFSIEKVKGYISIQNTSTRSRNGLLPAEFREHN